MSEETQNYKKKLKHLEHIENKKAQIKKEDFDSDQKPLFSRKIGPNVFMYAIGVRTIYLTGTAIIKKVSNHFSDEDYPDKNAKFTEGTLRHWIKINRIFFPKFSNLSPSEVMEKITFDDVWDWFYNLIEVDKRFRVLLRNFKAEYFNKAISNFFLT